MVTCLYLDCFWLNFWANRRLSTSLLSPVSEFIYQQHSSLTLKTKASSKTKWLHSSLLSRLSTTSFKLRSLNVFLLLSSLFEWAVITFSFRWIWRCNVSPSSSINLNFEMFYFWSSWIVYNCKILVGCMCTTFYRITLGSFWST
jgi:hypothetical protein